MAGRIRRVASGVQGGKEWTWDAVRFLVVCFSCLSVFAILYFRLRGTSSFDPVLAFNAWIASSTLNLFGTATQASGAVVSSADFSFRVIAECTSVVPTMILVSAVLGWPCSTRDKLVGIAMGAGALFGVNVVRLVSLFYIGSAFPRFLDVAHFIGWGFLMVLTIVALWLFWMKKAVRA